MACHHHHQSHPPPTTTTTCCRCCSTLHLSPPLPDPLLLALAAHVIQSVLPNHQQHHYHDPYSQYTKLNTPNPRPQNQYNRRHRRSQDARFEEIPESHSLLSSLFRRIHVLESSLHYFSTSSPSPYSSTPYSLRDLAARVIQTRFRAFLVRRSSALRQLKDLAVIKSTFNSIKSSLSCETHFDFDALSQKIMDLLLKLDSIQGGNPLIRAGKRSTTRDLVRFLKFIDGVAAKSHGLFSKTTKNVSFGHPNGNKSSVLGTRIKSLGGHTEMIDKLRARVEKISGLSRVFQNDEEDVEFEGFKQASDDDEENFPRVVIGGKNGQIRSGFLVERNGIQPRVKKSVSFAENRNVYIRDSTCLDQGEPVKNPCRELEEVKGFPWDNEDDEEAHFDHGSSLVQIPDQ
ncbi:hypothetical protein F2P56_000988 [Juglans regia]|uniref:BAG family molecular chaperone regulator 8, chloroplastic n=2 Tax=Juglans regia TaxID=51240 RepID=A0A833Y983_JUGRE|nr:BAG family molecular chaperone regulator 8, chloroplastic-like [Juglans regia]KAF5480223.1 hypothetical protein F2P56_000988 [Juglans regia]